MLCIDGALMEIGPYRVGKGGKLHYNDGSWDEFANVLFVDNPVGTGFSYVDTNSYLHELQEMADQFLIFMEKWYALFPDYLHDDVSPGRKNAGFGSSWCGLIEVDIHCRRVLCRPTHSLHWTRHPRCEPKEEARGADEPQRSYNRQRLD